VNHIGKIYIDYPDVKFCKAVERLILNKKDVLDLGAGFGFYGRYFLRHGLPYLPYHPEAEENIFKSVEFTIQALDILM
jgi:hypothetical protein